MLKIKVHYLMWLGEYRKPATPNIQRLFPDDGLYSPDGHKELEAFFEKAEFAHHHWGYQPYRRSIFVLPTGDVHDVFDITGTKEQLFIWNDPNLPVIGG